MKAKNKSKKHKEPGIKIRDLIRLITKKLDENQI